MNIGGIGHVTLAAISGTIILVPFTWAKPLQVLEDWPPVAFMGLNYLSIPKLQRLHRWSLGMDK